MDWNLILFAVTVMAGAGLLMGALLAVASVKFHVEVDPRVERVRAVLPGANCGACGLPGCDAAAAAIVAGTAAIGVCTAGGHAVKEAVAAVLGLDAGEKTAPALTVVRCQGGRGKAQLRYDYEGVPDCKAASMMAGGPLACAYGCLGFGDCERACAFDAIAIGPEGLPVVNLHKCTRCGLCIKACPRGIIAYLPPRAEVADLCMSRDRGPVVRKACSIGCIACKACEKVCEPGAIVVSDNLAVIDYAKCTACGKCIEKCPPKCLVRIAGSQPTA